MRHCAQRRGEVSFADGVLRKENTTVNTYLIVGLGNMGEKYAHTRHNAGFEVMSRLEAYYGVKLRKKLLLQGMTAEVTDGETKVVLCEPLTFMNRSGDCVRRLLARFRVPQEKMLVIYDDIDLPPGKVRMRKNGGPGTHNGMRSIAQQLGETDFPRLRVGTGDRPAGQDLAAWVLGHPAAEEKEKKIQNTMLDLQHRYGKNAVLKGMNLKEGATTIERNGQVGGHKA